MSYPLFDAGFTLWAADLDARLMDRHGRSCRALGVDTRLLLGSYYGGASVNAALELIASTYRLEM